jgi:hypothetical protein
MLNKEDWMQIQAQIEKGVYQKDIAHRLGVLCVVRSSGNFRSLI